MGGQSEDAAAAVFPQPWAGPERPVIPSDRVRDGETGSRQAASQA